MKLLSFGEILWDIVDSEELLGGAPFNLAAHAGQCGAECAMISCIGQDYLGDKALAEAKKMDIDCRYIQRQSTYPTGTVDAVVSESGQPDYIIHEQVAYDFIKLDDNTVNDIAERKFDVFCFGTLAQRNEVPRQSLIRLLDRLRKSNTRIFCDVNLRQNYYSLDTLDASLRACDILKLNDQELDVLSQLFYDKRQMAVEEFCERISRQMYIDDILVTLGENGAAVFNSGRFETVPGSKVEVVDTIGAGDAFSAVFLCKRLTGSSPLEAAMLANRVGAFVASQRGAIPQYSQEVLHSIGSIGSHRGCRIGDRITKTRSTNEEKRIIT